MKLTSRTIPQARNYQCNKCKSICCHKDMHNDNLCYSCWEKEDFKIPKEDGWCYICKNGAKESGETICEECKKKVEEK